MPLQQLKLLNAQLRGWLLSCCTSAVEVSTPFFLSLLQLAMFPECITTFEQEFSCSYTDTEELVEDISTST